jgi:RNA polymerase sigma factor (sigma-70 family)
MTRSASKRADNPLISDEPTIDLVIKAQSGDAAAVEALLQRSLPSLKRWARGRLPAAARGHLDTGDLVQDAVFHAVKRLHAFEPRRVGAMQAYLRRSVLNRIRDEVRRVIRRPPPVELPEDLRAPDRSPLEQLIKAETYQHYRDALMRLKPRDRAVVVARLEAQWSTGEIQKKFAMPSDSAARMTVLRALRRLLAELPAE